MKKILFASKFLCYCAIETENRMYYRWMQRKVSKNHDGEGTSVTFRRDCRLSPRKDREASAAIYLSDPHNRGLNSSRCCTNPASFFEVSKSIDCHFRVKARNRSARSRSRLWRITDRCTIMSTGASLGRQILHAWMHPFRLWGETRGRVVARIVDAISYTRNPKRLGDDWDERKLLLHLKTEEGWRHEARRWPMSGDVPGSTCIGGHVFQSRVRPQPHSSISGKSTPVLIPSRQMIQVNQTVKCTRNKGSFPLLIIQITLVIS